MTDLLLLSIAIVVFVIEAATFRLIHVMEGEYRGRPGSFLLWVVARFGLILVTAQGLVVLNAVLRYVDGTADARGMIFVAVEALQGTAFFWAVMKIRELRDPVHLNLEEAAIEPVQPSEGV